MRDHGRALWRIRHDLFWSRCFARLAGPALPGSPRYDMHAELARLYFELAEAYRLRNNVSRAEEAQRAAQFHERESEPPNLPPAIANVASPADMTYRRTDARTK